MYMLEDTLALRSDTSTCHVCSSLYELATNRGDVYMSNAGLNFQYIVSASSIEGGSHSPVNDRFLAFCILIRGAEHRPA